MKMKMHASQEVKLEGGILKILGQCGGYYECLKDEKGRRLTPLVGYAKRYDGVHQLVGDVYYNFAMAEQYPHVRSYFAALIAKVFNDRNIQPDVIVGAPMGGILLSGDIGRY